MKYLVMVIVIQFLILSNEVLQAQWVQTNGPNRGIVHCFAVSGINIFAGSDSGGVYLSTDNGSNWTQIINGMTKNPCIYSLIANGNNIYAGSKEGLYYSSNNGADWT